MSISSAWWKRLSNLRKNTDGNAAKLNRPAPVTSRRRAFSLASPMRKLTPKQQQFVEEYLVDLNATQAAIRAGYSAKTAEFQASRLLRNAKVQAAIAERMKAFEYKSKCG